MSAEPRDPLARLKAADPYAGAAYEPPHLDDLINRVTAREPVRRLAVARGLRFRVASAAAGAVLVSAGAIGALQSVVPTAAPLVFGSAALHAPQQYYAAAEPTVANAKATSGPVSFVAGANLATNAATAPAYTFVRLSLASAFPKLVAALNGGTGVIERTGSTSAKTAGSSVGTLSARLDGPVVKWTEVRTMGRSLVCVATTRSAEVAAAKSMVAATGVRASLGDASWRTVADGDQLLTLVWRISGAATPFNFSFRFNTCGLVAARGVNVQLRRLANYPLVSAVTGVAELHETPVHGVAPVVPPSPVSSPAPPVTTPIVSTPTTINPGGPMIPAPTTTTTINPGGPMIPASPPSTGTTTSTVATPVVLTAATLEYGVYRLADGGFVLLPQYRYTSASGAIYRVLAISGRDIRRTPGI